MRGVGDHAAGLAPVDLLAFSRCHGWVVEGDRARAQLSTEDCAPWAKRSSGFRCCTEGLKGQPIVSLSRAARPVRWRRSGRLVAWRAAAR
jgi:hypothetical protein